MLALAEKGEQEGVWLRAGRQTGGRGRMGRSWESADGNLFCSTLVRIVPHDPAPHTLALVAANAAHALIAPICAGRARIKWPNDILVDNAKIAGILIERAGDAVVVGIGVNVTTCPFGLDRPVTSLLTQGATGADAGVLVDRLSDIFRHWLGVWRAHGLEPVRTHWLLNAHSAGAPLRAVLPDGEVVDGMFETLDRQGMLILRLANGDSRVIHAGDVLLP